MKLLSKAIKAPGKRLPFTSERKQNEILEYAAGSLAEAYRIGAEEAQTEILSRLRKIKSDAEIPAHIVCRKSDINEGEAS